MLYGDIELGDLFGSALAGGDFDGDHTFDAAIGVPGECVNGILDAGGVNIIRGSEAGLSEDLDQLLTQGTPGIKGAVGPDRFGAAAASGAR